MQAVGTRVFGASVHAERRRQVPKQMLGSDSWGSRMGSAQQGYKGTAAHGDPKGSGEPCWGIHVCC